MTLLLSTLIFAPLAFASVEPWAQALLQIALFALAARTYAQGRDLWANPLYKNLLPAVLGLALLGLLQALNESPVTGPSSVLFTAWRPATLAASLNWLFYAAVLYAVPQVINTPERFEKLMWTVFGLGVAVALLGMFQKTGDNTFVYGIRKVPGQAFGPFINRDHGAHFLVMAAMCGLGLFFSGFRDLVRHQSRTRLFDLYAIQLLKLVMVGALVYGVFHAGSRGGLHSFALAALAAGAVAGSFLKTPRYRLLAWLGLALLLAGYALFLNSNPYMLGFKDGEMVKSVTMRFSMYKSALAMIKDFPLFGSGLGAVEFAFPPYKLPDMPAAGLVRHVHSDWMEIFVQAGFAGGLLYLAGLAAAVAGFFKTWRNCRSFRLKAMYGGALGALLAAATHNFVEFGSQMPANALLFFTLAGALASGPPVWAHRRSADDEVPEPRRRRRHLRRSAYALAAVLCLWALPAVVAWQYDQRAAQAPYPEKARLLQQALLWRPNPQYAFRLAAAHYKAAFEEPDKYAAYLETAADITGAWLYRAPANYDLQRLREKVLYFRLHPPKRP